MLPIATPTIPTAPSLPAVGGTVPGAATVPHQVEGRIFFDHGLPAGGVALRVYSKGFGGEETRLGEEIKTDDYGSYALTYDPGGQAANLEVRMVDAEGKETPLSATKFNAGKHEVLNLVAPPSMQSQASEFHLMANDLVGRVGGDLSKLALAKENDELPGFVVAARKHRLGCALNRHRCHCRKSERRHWHCARCLVWRLPRWVAR